MNKFKNYSFMLGLVSAVLMVIVQILAAFNIYISTEVVSNVISVILGALVVLGIVNKPTPEEEEKKDELLDDLELKDDEIDIKKEDKK